MNKDWIDLNRTMQGQLKEADTFPNAIVTLKNLRDKLMDEVNSWLLEIPKSEFSAIPFLNEDGYKNKTLAYSLWHIFRIEDIVTHTLINNDEQIFFSKNHQKKMRSPIITTGNELIKEQIEYFSKQLDIDDLYLYIHDVKKSTEEILDSLSYTDLDRSFSSKEKEKIKSLKVVSRDENARWLIDYWCDKDIRGLIRMPLSSHWIMHIEACIEIKDKIRSMI